MQKIRLTDFFCEMKRINRLFPNLIYLSDQREVIGDISFCSRYVNIGEKESPVWNIEQGKIGKNGSVRGDYSIRITFADQGHHVNAKVFETGGRIRLNAQTLHKDQNDVHLNGDGSCCLGIFPDVISLYDFLLERVYSYFVWQAWLEKYRKTPPCGDCPHNENQALLKRIEEERHRLRLSGNDLKFPKGSKRNKLCVCGSGKKYKNCCFGKLRQQLLVFMEKQKS